MLENLFIMERLVVQNQYHFRQAAYRGLEDIICKLFYTIRSNKNLIEFAKLRFFNVRL